LEGLNPDWKGAVNRFKSEGISIESGHNLQAEYLPTQNRPLRSQTTARYLAEIEVMVTMKENEGQRNPGGSSSILRKLTNRIWIAVGTILVTLGVIGIFLPLLPTTPFLLAAAACYARGSKRFYTWLLNNKWFGEYIRNYREGKGVPMRVKIISLSLLWLTIGFSAFSVVPLLIGKVILIMIAIAVSLHLILLPTLKKTEQQSMRR